MNRMDRVMFELIKARGSPVKVSRLLAVSGIKNAQTLRVLMNRVRKRAGKDRLPRGRNGTYRLVYTPGKASP